MAGSTQSGDDEIISGINVTPLVDVVLVLLVIFMVTAPVIYQSAIKVKLPQTASGGDGDKNSLSFSVDAQENIYWNSLRITWGELEQRLGGLSAADKEKSASISADEKASHGQVVKLMDVLQRAGLHRFSLNVSKRSGR